MIKSMTGYGKAVALLPGRHLAIEIKSLNSKGLDLNVRIPSWFREREMDVRSLLGILQRGKIDLFITASYTEESAGHTFNKPLALRYYKILKEFQTELNEDNPEGLLPLIVRMPDLIQPETMELDSEGWAEIRSGIMGALNQVDRSRTEEGIVLMKDLSMRVNRILELSDMTGSLDDERKDLVRNNLRRALDQYLAGNGTTRADSNRFEQELIYYLEKMDFTEEKVRLRKHCEYFRETLEDPQSQGKRLGFICQEMGREINTLGSKASHAGIQKLVVQMKDELEKIKEQLLNIL